ncbi:MAG: glutamine synthetase family protein [Lachnospiraceae bacterium]|nr:glutamine synthetase family protein [Lachnospiraceae bacterium]
MYYTETEAIEFLHDHDVTFIRLEFCDPYGMMKNVSIMSTDINRAFTVGISIDASAIQGFATVDESDLFLRPVPSTLTLLPWRPAQGRTASFYCEITYPDGRPFEMDSRRILQRAVDHAEAQGIRCSFGAECEFYLFQRDEEGNPTRIPSDNASYMDVAPLDKGENVRREICLALQQMDFAPEASRHEVGPGQNEIDFRYSDAMTSADNVQTFKSVVETVAAANGLHANFRPKPLADQAGNGFHVNMSPRRLGSTDPDPDLKRHFMAGILARVREITAFLNPTEESYRRLGSFKAPRYVSWSPLNRSQLIRIPAGTGEYDRIELRSADCMTNPYLAYALLLEAGLEGIAGEWEPPEPVNRNLYEAPESELQGIPQLPSTYCEAIRLAEESRLVRKVLPEGTLAAYRSQIRE